MQEVCSAGWLLSLREETAAYLRRRREGRRRQAERRALQRGGRQLGRGRRGPGEPPAKLRRSCAPCRPRRTALGLPHLCGGRERRSWWVVECSSWVQPAGCVPAVRPWPVGRGFEFPVQFHLARRGQPSLPGVASDGPLGLGGYQAQRVA